MMSANPVETLELQREFKAPIERVFAAWTQSEVLAQWFGPEGFPVLKAEADCRPHGKYDITIQSPDNKIIRHFGEYLEVDKPNKLIFTWELENQDCQGSADQVCTTLVELTFTSTGQGTLLQLKHEKLPDQTALDGHRFGWSSSFDSLESILRY